MYFGTKLGYRRISTNVEIETESPFEPGYSLAPLKHPSGMPQSPPARHIQAIVVQNMEIWSIIVETIELNLGKTHLAA